jgi:hypothetical protein
MTEQLDEALASLPPGVRKPGSSVPEDFKEHHSRPPEELDRPHGQSDN